MAALTDGCVGRLARLDRTYMAPSAGYAYVQTLAPLALLIGALAAARTVQHPVAAILLFVSIGLIQYRIYFPLHECSHLNFFRTSRENQFFGYLNAAILATPFEEFRYQHMEHHRLVGTAEDPSAVDYWVSFRSRRDMLMFLLAPLVGGSLLMKLSDYYRGLVRRDGTAVKEPVRPVQRLPGILSVMVVQGSMLVWLSHEFQAWELWRYAAFVLGPGATIFLFLSRLRMYLEHGSVDYDRIDYTRQPRLTARTILGSWWERIVLSGVNFNYHHEHHRYPRVPAFQLPRLYAEVTRQTIASDDLRPTYSAALGELWRHLSGRKA